MKRIPPFGITKEGVKRLERGRFGGESKPSPNYPGLSFMYFSDTMAGLGSTIYYDFGQNGELFRVVYAFPRKYSNKNLHIADYQKIKEMLIKIYGRPRIDEQVWELDFYRDKPDEWGEAIAYGHLHYRAEWEEGDTVITLRLRGADHGIRHDLTYVDKNRRQQVRKKLEKKRLTKDC